MKDPRQRPIIETKTREKIQGSKLITEDILSRVEDNLILIKVWLIEDGACPVPTKSRRRTPQRVIFLDVV